MDIYKNLQITDEEFVNLRDLMYKTTGVFLKDTKKILVVTRLRKRLNELNIDTFADYYNYLAVNRAEFDKFINAITTNETFFFRNDKHFDFLKGEWLPEIIKERKDHKIKIWSAACSTGEEPYSIYIFLLENLPNPSVWNIQIDATDINTDVLNAAKKAEYGQERMRATPPHIVNKYFEKSTNHHGGAVYNLKAQFKDKVRFRQHNLLNVYGEKEFDLVFLRNVLIYFDVPMKKIAIQNAYKVIKPGGYLFLGHSEGMLGIESDFDYVQPSVFRSKVRT
jgi:chemotaxis protein methyltransferase CheR